MTHRPADRGRSGILLALAGGLAALVSACAGLPPLRVASDLDNPPFASADAEGRPQGRDVEMMHLIAARLDRELVWVRMPFEQLLPAVAAGEVDVVCATLGVTPERAERVDFTRPYFRTEIALLARSGDGQPARPADLAGRPVGASSGTTAERAVRRALGDARLSAGDGKTGGVQRLLLGEIDALALDAPAAEAALRAAPARLRLIGTIADEHYALALPKGRSSLRVALDESLGVLERSGSLARLNAAHGLVETQPPQP